MSDAELWSAWRLWLGVAGLIVVVAASLLVSIWLTARRIRSNALRALRAVEAIREQTQPIWALQQTNEVAQGLLDTVQSIEQKGGSLAEALTSHSGASGTR